MSTRVSIESPYGDVFELGVQHCGSSTEMFKNPYYEIKISLEIESLQDVAFYLGKGYRLKNEWGDYITIDDLLPIREWK